MRCKNCINLFFIYSFQKITSLRTYEVTHFQEWNAKNPRCSKRLQLGIGNREFSNDSGDRKRLEKSGRSNSQLQGAINRGEVLIKNRGIKFNVHEHIVLESVQLFSTTAKQFGTVSHTTWHGSIVWQRDDKNRNPMQHFEFENVDRFILSVVIHCSVQASCQWNISLV